MKFTPSVLEQLSPLLSALEPSNLEYVLEVLQEPESETALHDATELNNLIGDFLIDSPLASSTEDSFKVASQIVSIFCPQQEGTSLQPSKQNSSSSNKLDHAIKIDDQLDLNKNQSECGKSNSPPKVKKHISSKKMKKIQKKAKHSPAATVDSSSQKDQTSSSPPSSQSFFIDSVNNDVDEFSQITVTRNQNDIQRSLNSNDVNIRGLTVSVGTNEILNQAHLKLETGHKYGLIGKNGIGKTTLLKFIASKRIEQFPAQLRTFLVEQEVTIESELTALECVKTSNTEKQAIMEKIRQIESEGKVASLQTELMTLYAQVGDVGQDDANVRMILKGLSFSEKMMETPVRLLSGGWKMRVSLACALFIQPDILMLDEPTNHLDLEAAFWLSNWLKTYEKILIIVSHDRHFLNDVVTDIIYFNAKNLMYVPGNWDSFQKKKEDRVKQQQKEQEIYSKEQKRIKNSMEKYKSSMRAHNPNASLGQVGNFKKKLEKLEVEHDVKRKLKQGAKTTGLALKTGKVFDEAWKWGGQALFVADEEAFDPEVRFSFPQPENLGVSRSILAIADATIGYEPQTPLIEDVTFDVSPGDKIVLMGPNGVGKSTLLLTLAEKLAPLAGQITRQKTAPIGFFTQHHVQNLDFQKTPLELMTDLVSNSIKEDKLRGHLSSFGITGQLAIKPVALLSGGQKSRVVFALETFLKPPILVLDEPTNHLDYASIDGLVNAAVNFQGVLIIVSHDIHLLRSLESAGEKTRFLQVVPKTKKLVPTTLDKYLKGIKV